MKARIAIVVLGLSGVFCLSAGISRPHAAAVSHDDKAIVHVLNRVGFGPRPGDVEKVRQIGIERYVEDQLHPERIPDSGLAARLSGLDTITLSSRDIADQYERPALEARREKQQRVKMDTTGGDVAAAMPPDPRQRRANTVIVQLSEQKVLRAVYSERQLQEVLTDFWFNHFNVDARKGVDRFLVTEYERETIRPHVLGTFRELLEATARSPAMLFYLDNWMSASATDAPRVAGRRFGPFVRPGLAPGGQRGPAPKKPKGLNENYGRELMELHTLGVDGGYTQHDVTEVARAFTGWTIQQPRQGGGFRFEPRLHDDGEKVVLGHRIKAHGGMNDGEQVLDILAAHPSTARFIATTLVRRFVADTPPPGLVDRVAARFHASGGDLREVMRMILTAKEFQSPDAYRAKVKTPFEFVVSAARATHAEIADAAPLVRALQQLGMPPYQCQPPTGYADSADAWVNTGALVSRMNFAQQLAALISRQPPGGDQPAAPGDPSATSTAAPSILRVALNDDVSETTRATIAKASTMPQMIALTLGAPEFQRR